MRVIDLTGQKFGRLTVLERAGSDKRKRALWLCECECGNKIIATGSHLITGHTKSCGCIVKRHGLSRTKLWRVWCGILARCGVWKGSSNKTRAIYELRGISVCSDWLNFENFRDWALESGYTDGLTIDRIDNERGYSPDNCRWSTYKENNNNRRCTKKFNGVPISDICRCIGLETWDTVRNHATKEFDRIGVYYTRHNGDLPPDIKARYEAYLKERC